MTFLNPFVLFGLIAAAIPVILHLLNLRKLRTVEFSTLAFLKELQQTKIRRLKLRQLLLLVIRTLLVIFTVLAFARPALRGTILGTIGANAHSTVVFILDDSFSMTGTDENGELFKQAKEAARKLIDLWKEGDEAFLIRLSDLPRATIEHATHDFTALRTAIDEFQPSSVRRPMDEALRLSAKLLASSKNANKEVYLISDMQRTLFPGQTYRKDEAALSLFDKDVRFFTIELGSKEPANVSIDSIEVETKILEKQKPVTLRAHIRNFGGIPLRNYVVSIFLDGVRSAQNNVQLEPWGPADVELTVIPKHEGFIKGSVELENDVIEQDNRRFFTLYVPYRINVAMVGSAPSDLSYPLLALTAGDAKSLLTIQQTTYARFPLLDLKTVDVLLLSNIKTFSAGDAGRIEGFLERGGGLILFPGTDTQFDNYNATLLPALHIPPIEGAATSSAPQGDMTFQRVDTDHPLFATVFETGPKERRRAVQSVESPAISKAIKRQTGKQGRTVIGLNDGAPFLSEHTVGEGTVLFFSVAPDLSWSDFPLKGIFAPLLYRSVIYISKQEDTRTSYITGEEPLLKLKRPSPTDRGKLQRMILPDGSEERIKPAEYSYSQSASGTTISFTPERLLLPGFYELMNDTSTALLFAVNTDNLESDCRKISSEDASLFWSKLGVPPGAVQSLRLTDQLQARVVQSRLGIELWKYCIGAALLLALIEMGIARDTRSETHKLSTA